MVKNKKIEFSLDYMNILDNDEETMIVELYLLHEGLNRNMCDISHECVLKSLKSFYNKPIIYKLNNTVIQDLSTDVTGHNHDKQDSTMFIAGVIPANSPIEFVEIEDKTYVKSLGCIHKLYQPTLSKIIENRGGNLKVSIEMMVLDGNQDIESGVLTINKFQLLGVCLLGENVKEGIEGSHMEVVKFSLEDYNSHYLSFSQKEYHYEIPAEIKRSVKRGIELKNNSNKAISSEAFSISSYLLHNSFIDGEKIHTIYNYFNTTNGENRTEYSLYGGQKGKKWVEKIIKSEEKDMKGLSDKDINGMIEAILKDYKYTYNDWETNKYYVEENYIDSRIVIVRDVETSEFYKIPYSIEDKEVLLHMDEKKRVKRGYVDFSYASNIIVTFAKENYGTKEDIEVDESKESMSYKDWAAVNKSELRKTALEAKNYKSLIKDIYALVEDGWEDAPSEKLKYPIMEIKEGKAIYNRYGLASALAYAKVEGETAVINKIESLYKKLDINEKNGGEKEMENIEKHEEEVVLNKENEEKLGAEEIKENEEVQNQEIEDTIEKKEEEKEQEIEKPIEKEEDAIEEKEEEKEQEDTIEEKKEEENLEEEASDKEEEDKDYWKNKYEEKVAEEEKRIACEQLKAKLEKFAHCMSKEKIEEIKNSIEKCSIEEVDKKINEEIEAFALKMREKAEDNKGENIEFSFNPYYVENGINKFDDKLNLDTIIKGSNVKLG